MRVHNPLIAEKRDSRNTVSMILLGNILQGLAQVLGSLITIAQFLIFARVIVSWLSADPRNKLVSVIVGSTEPMMAPLRRRLPLVIGPVDLTPIALILGLIFLKSALVASLAEYGMRLKVGSLGIGGASF
ncbi:MAG: YggT family protein [Bdellovibrionota bacterium]